MHKRAPRISCEITEDQAKALNEMLDYGEQKRLFSSLIDGVIHKYEKHGKAAIYAIMAGRADLVKVASRIPEHQSAPHEN